MKTNLDSMFKTDSSLEKDGVWFTLNETTKFRIRRFGGANSQKLKLAFAKHHKPKARLIELGQLSADETQLVMVKVFVESALVEWEGVEAEGKALECTPENAIKLFTNLPELFESLWKYANDVESFKEDLGNS